MGRRTLTLDRHEEIKRRLADGRSLREIATALGCSRRLVRQIRDDERLTHETAARPELEYQKGCFPGIRRIGRTKPLSVNRTCLSAKYERAEPRGLAPELIESPGVRTVQTPLFDAVLDRPMQWRSSPARRDAGVKRPMLSEAQPRGGVGS